MYPGALLSLKIQLGKERKQLTGQSETETDFTWTWYLECDSGLKAVEDPRLCYGEQSEMAAANRLRAVTLYDVIKQISSNPRGPPFTSANFVTLVQHLL